MKTTIYEKVLFGALLMACGALAVTYMPSFKEEKSKVTSIKYDQYPYPTQHWAKNGTNAAVRLYDIPVKKIYITLTPGAAIGTIDISGLNLTTIMSVQISAYRSGSTASTSPQVSKTVQTTSSIGWNLTQTNTAVVSILGINVLSGLPLVASTDLSSIQLQIEITGY